MSLELLAASIIFLWTAHATLRQDLLSYIMIKGPSDSNAHGIFTHLGYSGIELDWSNTCFDHCL